MKGKIIKNISNDYTVETQDRKKYICKPRGKFRINNLIPLVGDIVEFDEKNNYLTDILPRKNELIRPSIANIDIAVIITSVKNPNFDTTLLDKTLTIISYNKIEPIIYFTKLDLLNNEELQEINKYLEYYQQIGYIVSTNPDDLIHKIQGKTVVFTGQSGAGKSTLLNKLDSNLNIKTDQISYALGRGKHTTRHVELLNIYNGWVADTPGFSSLDLTRLSNNDIKQNFIEFNNYEHLCKYKDCMHDKENECGVKQKVKEKVILESRYLNYLKFIKR